MIYELRIYEYKPGEIENYFAISAAVAKGIRGQEHGALLGFWTAKQGDVDMAVHIWSYDSLDHRQRAREALQADPRWSQEFLARVVPLFSSQEVRFFAPASQAMPTSSTRRSYCLETFDTLPEARRELLDALKAWREESDESAQLFTGISPWPNSVVVLRSMGVAGWPPSTIANTVLRERIEMCATRASPLQ